MCSVLLNILYIFEENIYFSIISFLVTKVNASYFLTPVCSMSL